ncbi:hypothetical protein TMatcc_000281 [Talaromyces marneffei ATCC 18224]
MVPDCLPNLSTETLLSGLPVKDFPDSLEVLGLAVLVLEAVVSVLPGIDTEKRGVLANDRVLVLFTYLDRNITGLLILHQPRPTTALNARQSSIELILKLPKATVRLINRLTKHARGGFTTTGTLRSQIFPEQGMVDVATTVEVDERLKGDLGCDVALGLRFLQFFDVGVVAGYVDVVVALVVDFHDLAGDGWFEGAIVIYIPLVDCRQIFRSRHVYCFDLGRVTLVRTKLVPARPARGAEAPARKAARAVELRKRVADIVNIT